MGRLTHSKDCWMWHPECAKRKIAELDKEKNAWKHEAIVIHCTWMGITYEESENIVQEYVDDHLRK